MDSDQLRDWATLEVGFDVRRNPEGGTLEIETNDPEGRVGTSLRVHPDLAAKLRDWLNGAYPSNA